MPTNHSSGSSGSRSKRIESPANPEIRALARLKKEGYRDRWLIEGRILLQEAVDSGVRPDEVYVSNEIAAEVRNLLQQLEEAGTSVIEVTRPVMKSISELDTPPGILGVVARTNVPPPETIRGFAAMVVGLRDPGNLGSLIRSAEAAGCEFVACSTDSADPHQPKVVRAAMGSLFRVPVFRIGDPGDLLRRMAALGVTRYALVPREGTSLDAWTPRHPALVVIGGETSGIPAELEVDQRISIPMEGRVESLNAAVAGTLCFYRLRRSAD